MKKIINNLSLLISFIVLISTLTFGQANVIITEVCDASTYQASFVEIYNAGDANQDITNWELYENGSKIYTVGSITLSPGQYMVFIRGTINDLEGLFNTYQGDYYDSGNGIFNGSDYFELKDNSSVLQDNAGTSGSTTASNSCYQRNDALSNGQVISTDWTKISNRDDATPGYANSTVLANDNSGVISEPTSLSVSQITNDKMNITWTKPGGTFNTDWHGVVVFVRDGSANDAVVASTDGIDFTGNLTYGSGTLSGNSYCVARQATDADGDIVVTGLTEGNTYYVIAYTYKEVTGDYNDDSWSDAATETNDIANIEETSSFTANGGNLQAGLSWTNPAGTVTDYWDQVIVLAKSGSAVDATPSGDPSSYTANAAFGSGTEVGTGNFVVYKGTGTSETVTSLTNGITYYFKAFVYYLDEGSAHDYSSGVTSSATPNLVITPSSGDLIITEFSGGGINGAYQDEFIELYNNTDNPIDLSTVHVKYYESTQEGSTLDLSGQLSARDFYIIAARTSGYINLTPDVNGSWSFNNSGYVELLESTTIIDYAGTSSDKLINGKNYERIDLTQDGTDITNHWIDIGSNATDDAINTNIAWNGSTTDWNTGSNWDFQSVPGSTTNVVIPSGGSLPVITSAAECNNLTIDASATLDINPNYSLTVNGDLTINGTFTINSDATGTGSLIT
ncbi:MAG: hypothetical protein GXO79_05120, partial [Chlorobi bacterium]|nr:hypothetical protein [Chlorobiota bacterium]